MENTEQNMKKSGRLKTAIILLSVLLVLSAGGLIGRCVYLTYFAKPISADTVPDNLIDDGSSRHTEPAPSGPTPNGNETTDSNTTPSQSLPRPESSNPVRKANSLRLYRGKPGDNERFEVRMLITACPLL